MRRLVPLALAAVTASLVTLPARADAPGQECWTYLVLAKTGQDRGCATIGGTLPNDDQRILTVAVQTGQVTATLACGGDPLIEKTIVVTAPFTDSVTVDRTTYCWATLTATVDNTTAVAVDRSGEIQK